MIKKIRVSLKNKAYDIIIGDNLLKNCGPMIKKLRIGKDAVIITNNTLRKLYGGALEKTLRKSGIETRFEIIPDSEKAKSPDCLLRILAKINTYDKNKTIFVIALGGGVVGDLAGLVAAIYKRGIPYIQIPTTLLAQVDSAIGGKVAIDLPTAKNTVGAFYQPRAVISDISLIRSLPRKQIANSLAEIIKYGIIKDNALFAFLEKNYKRILNGEKKALEFIIARCAKIKAGVVSEDELDKTGKRAILNYGHTIGHAIETASGYSSRYLHGEAVAIGMVVAGTIARRLGLLTQKDLDRIRIVISNVGLPTKAGSLDLKKIYAAHLRDKKFIHGKNRFVLPVSIGKVRIVENIPERIIKLSIKESVKS